jgi:hypothetical protein
MTLCGVHMFVLLVKRLWAFMAAQDSSWTRWD